MTTTWALDQAHTGITFSVRHMGIATVRGRFTQFSGSVELDEGGALTGVEATIDAASIDTGVEQRDAHLRSADFFDVDRFPTLTFRSTMVRRRGDDGYDVEGDLTLHGESHPVRLAVEVTPQVTDPWGKERVAATATGTLDRRRWGLTWNQVLESGGLLVSDEVRLTLDVQAVAAEPVAAP
jgi:polyisoprenoid-binding protein YceI